MKQKLIAAAVVGAFAAPAAFAQSTVQIYGLLNAEYGFVSQPSNAAGVGRLNADGFNSGASRIGFKGEEKLGGGMSAWFQCESDIRFLAGGAATGTRGANSGEWCDRNSAIGLKGGFGSFFVGTWDSPLKQTVAKTRILNETGWIGVQHMLLSGAIFDNSNRNAQSINYVTPNFGGFTARGQVTSTNAAFDQLDTNNNAKGRHVGFGADYSQGPLVVAAGMEKSDDNRSLAGAAGAKDTSYAIGATYVFGAFKPGVTYTNQKAEDGVGNNIKKKAWNLALDWKITGPGTVRFGYTQHGDYSTNLGDIPESGAKMWQIGYQHALSKRTVAGVSYARIDNDNQGFANFTNRTNDISGDNASVVVFNLGHTF
jgi:predicted porin